MVGPLSFIFLETTRYIWRIKGHPYAHHMIRMCAHNCAHVTARKFIPRLTALEFQVKGHVIARQEEKWEPHEHMHTI